MSQEREERARPVIHDRRRIDPVTGQVRDPQAGDRGPHAGARRGPGAEGTQGAAEPAAPARPGRHSASQPGGTGGTGGAGAPGVHGTPGAAGQEPAGGHLAAGSADAAEEAGAAARLAERTADLQRLQAEYANYRKRVERDRLAVREQALANVLTELLPVLDDIGRAREHGELTGGFKSVAESLEATVGKLGLTSFGEEGEPFDPNLHEALMHEYSDEVTEPTSVRVLQPGYKVGSRILRPARVAVAEPGGPGPASSSGEPASGRAQPDQDEVTGKPQEAGESGNAAAGQEAAGPSGASGPSGAPGPPGAEAD